MRRVLILMILISPLVYSQPKLNNIEAETSAPKTEIRTDEYQRVLQDYKELIGEMYMQINRLEKQNAMLIEYYKFTEKFRKELKEIKTMEELEKLLKKYELK